MATEETIQGYFDSLKQRKDWKSFLADDMTFTSYTSPVNKISGKDAYIEATKRFYSSIVSMEVRDIMIDDQKALALTHYELKHPRGNIFTSDVAEIFTLKNGKIISFEIYFDTAPFPK
ncbi:nuclear transport factor 2 family protein [bacterium]|nr:nuclear transport factor 2 family protein [bacterium]